ncbi:MAG: hypothetical protein AAF614_01700 [Chloroflexota bacterium]
MNWIIAMVSGLVLGWLAEWLIDASFWRKRRICTDNEAALESSVSHLRTENESLLSQIQNFTKQATQTQTSQHANYETLLTDFNRQSGEMATLRSNLTELHACKAQVSSLTAELKSSGSRIGDLNVQIGEHQTARTRLETQLAELRTQMSNDTSYETLLTDYNRQSGELSGLRSELTELHTYKTQVSSLTADLDASKNRIGQLGEQISEQHTVRAGLEAQVAELKQVAELRQAAELAQLTKLQKQTSHEANYETLLTDFNRQSGELSGLRSELTELHACKGQVSSLTADLKSSGERIGELNAQIDEQQTVRIRLETQVAELTQLVELGQVTESDKQNGDNSNYETLLTDYTRQSGELTELRSELAVLQPYKTQVSSLTADLQSSNERIGQLNVQISEHHTLRAGLEAQLAEFQTYKEQITTLTSSAASTKTQIRELKRELNKCQTVRVGVQSQLIDLRTRHAVNIEQAVEAQNLGMIWGITKPVNNELLAQGIITYHQLASAKLRDVETAVSLASRHYRNMNHTAIHKLWIEQAQIASVGQWEQLAQWQSDQFDVRSGRDDLQLLWGIGPKIEGILNAHGIYLWSQIAAIPAERLTEILRQAGERYRLSSDKLHTTWPEQAQLADLGRMAELKKLKAGMTWSKVNKGS